MAVLLVTGLQGGCGRTASIRLADSVERNAAAVNRKRSDAGRLPADAGEEDGWTPVRRVRDHQ